MNPDWLTLEPSDLTKSNWKRFGSKSNYLDNLYSSSWRIIISFKNQIASEAEAVEFISKSFQKYFSNTDELLLELSIAQINANKKQNHKDLIVAFSFDLTVKAMEKFLEEIQADISIDRITDFLLSNPDFTYRIPFIYEQNIIESQTQSNSWDSNSIQAFLRNNIFVQVKTTVLESEGNAIAIFIRKDLKLGKGKSGAQLSHGAVSLLYQPIFKNEPLEEFIKSDQKILLLYGVKDLKDLKEIEHLCLKNKINHSLIADAGHTQIAPGTNTVCAVGPMPKIWLKILAFNVEAIDLNI